MDTPAELTPYDLLGGSEAVRSLAEAFYDQMEALEPDLARLHPLDPDGRVSQVTRDRFALFFIGWLGGPQDYMAQHGHPRLRMRHAHVSIDARMRDAWMRCMRAALAKHDITAELREYLDERLSHVANFLRNAHHAHP